MRQREVDPERSIAEIYDRFAATYDSHRDLFDLTDVLRDFHAWLPARGALLDLGCGAGEPVAADFIATGWRVVGVDVSHGMLDLAASHVPAMTRIEADMRTVELGEDSFDAITAVYSLFHVPWRDHPAVFGRMRRWLRPGGAALFTYATSAYTGHDRFNGTMEFMGQELFYSHTTPEELFGQLRQAGLRVLDARNRDIGGETFLWVTAAVGNSSPRGDRALRSPGTSRDRPGPRPARSP